MNLEVMAVYDSKARAYLQPFFVSNIAVGARSFTQAANTAGHAMCAHPEDFSLWHLGSFNDEKAEFNLRVPYVNLGLASMYKSNDAGYPVTRGSQDV